ncbi:MAG: DUF1385 domain-containing protein [Candidatus Woesearchaeota archaeon]
MTFYKTFKQFFTRLKIALMLVVLSASRPVYGGQAVMEGVMMKGTHCYVTTVRTSEGYKRQLKPHRSLTKRYKSLRIPIIRGMIVLIETFSIGYKSLTYSSEVALEEENKKQREENGSKDKMSKESDDDPDSSLGDQLLIWGSVAVGIVFAIGLFKFLPLLAAKSVDSLFNVSDMVFNIVDGVFKGGIFILYMVIVGRLPDIKELFRYHGGEHKTINCMDAGEKLSVRNISKHSQEHLRCGTTFMFLVLFMSILVYLFIPKDLPFLINFGLRLALVPFIAGISYELQRFGALYSKGFGKIVLRPGLWLQSLSVNTPSPKHIRPARLSLQEAMKYDKKNS